MSVCLSVSASLPPPLPAGDHALPILSSWVLCMACPPAQSPCGCICPRGPPWIFLSCFTFHFRIPCRADPSPERPSSPRAYRSVARISYPSQAQWGEKEGLRDLPRGKLVGPFSPTHQPSRCGDTAALPGHWPVCVAIWPLRVGHRAKPSR